MEQLIAAVQAGARHQVDEFWIQARRLWGEEYRALPKRRADSLSADERMLVAIAGHLSADITRYGFFSRALFNLRLAGLSAAGPVDQLVTIAGEEVPIWCAVSDVVHGFGDHAALMSGLDGLSGETLVAAWNEMAGRAAYDLHEAIAATESDLNERRLSHRSWAVEQPISYLELLAEISLHLGAPGERAAIVIAERQLKRERCDAWAVPLALLSLSRHARGRGEALDTRFDELIARMINMPRIERIPTVTSKILEYLPRERGAKLALSAPLCEVIVTKKTEYVSFYDTAERITYATVHPSAEAALQVVNGIVKDAELKAQGRNGLPVPIELLIGFLTEVGEDARPALEDGLARADALIVTLLRNALRELDKKKRRAAREARNRS